MKYSRFSGADRFGPCRLHADIYEPIVNYLGIAGELSSAGSAIGRASRCTGQCAWMATRRRSNRQRDSSARTDGGWLAWEKLTEIED
jgi:hypothetical protein